MRSVGEYLREGREALGVSLEEISARTCISVRQLDALETNRLERLPGGLFNISFAKQYARELRLNEDEAVALIKDAMGVSAEAQPQSRMPARRARVAADGPASKLAEWASEFFRKHGGSVASLIIGATLIGGGFYSFRFLEEPSDAQTQARPVVAESVPVDPAPVVQHVSSPTAAEAEEAAAPIELTLEVVETVWVRAVVDGQRLFEETLSRGMVKPIHAQQQVELKVGNAGGLLLSLNGQDLPAIGPRGYVRSVTVTPQGMETIEGESPSRPTVVELPQSTAALRWAEVAWSNPVR